MIYPKDIASNLKFRAQVFLGGEKDSVTRTIVRELVEKDVLFFFNVFLWTYDPRTDMKHLPFVTYDFQDQYIKWIESGIEQGEDLFSDKSRDMGATWCIDGVFLHRFLYKRGEHFVVGSRKEDYVDTKGNLDTHFEKFRYELERLPWWLLPKGWNFDKHGKNYMRILNPENGNALIGEATNRNFARGGRPKAALFDEFQSWEMAEEAWRSASDATRCKIALGTPEGSANKFAELSRTTEIKRKHRLWWWMHPRKTGTSEVYIEKTVKSGEVYDKVGKYVVQLGEDQSKSPKGCYVDQYGKYRSEWYDGEHLRRDADNIAANLDINYLATGRPVFDTRVCNQRMMESLEPEIGDLVWKIRPIFNQDGLCINQTQLQAEFVKNINGLYRIWSHPGEKTHENAFVVGADTAEGLEQGDYDAAYVLSRVGTRPRIACVLHGHIRIHEYAEELAKVGAYYHRAFINVERNQHGHGVLLQLVKLYPWLWHKDIFSKGFAEITDRLGWETTSMSKPAVIGLLGKAISNNEFDCSDERFWKETLTYVEDDGKMEAQGKHRGEKCFDDRVMSMAITLWTHMNAPLPYPVKSQAKTYRWAEKKNNSQLVGWTV